MNVVFDSLVASTNGEQACKKGGVACNALLIPDRERTEKSSKDLAEYRSGLITEIKSYAEQLHTDTEGMHSKFCDIRMKLWQVCGVFMQNVEHPNLIPALLDPR
jgi:hypothetical protein